MSSITLKDIPGAVHQALKTRARRSGRSLNREVLAILTSTVAPKKITVDEWLINIRERRGSIPGRLTDKLLSEAKKIGRP